MDNINQYCIQHSEKETDILKKIKDYTFQNEKAPQMISGEIVGNVLALLIKSINAKKILEVGMFTGYSAVTMAQAVDGDGEIHTCELMEEHIKTAKMFFKESNYDNKIFIHEGLALETLENFKINTFDFAFIDADKINYINYYNRCMMLIRKGGIIVLDNMLWSGQVLDPKDDDSIALNKTAEHINNDNRVFNHMLTIRDGLMVCIKNG